jgi:hypothetical protein
MTKLKIGISALLLIGAGLALILQYKAQTSLREQNEFLRQKLRQLAAENESLSNRLAQMRRSPALRLPAPQLQTNSAPADEAPATNLLVRILHGGEFPRLTPEQLACYLQENHRSSTSLLSAYRTSRDPALLREAMQKYPGDPQVAFEAVFDKDASPAEHRDWLENFKKAAPDNSLANYLSALDYFKSGQTDLAVQELESAYGKQGFNDYTWERIQSDEEAFRSAGYSEAETSMASTWGITLPQLAQIRRLGQNMVDLATSYRTAGDDASAQATLQMAIGLGQQLDGPQGTSVPLISRMVGIKVEEMALGSMDPASPYGNGTVQQMSDQLAGQRTTLKQMVNQSVPFQDQMTPQDWISYNDRTRNFGEENAIRWLLNKYGQK